MLKFIFAEKVDTRFQCDKIKLNKY